MAPSVCAGLVIGDTVVINSSLVEEAAVDVVPGRVDEVAEQGHRLDDELAVRAGVPPVERPRVEALEQPVWKSNFTARWC